MASLIFTMRMSTVLATSVPSPKPECINAEEPVYQTMFATNTCNDMMFSGHTSINAIMLLFTLSAPGRNLIKIMHTGFFFTIAATILAVRDHYSMDILVAIYVVGGMYGWWRGEIQNRMKQLHEAPWVNGGDAKKISYPKSGLVANNRIEEMSQHN